MTQVHRKVPRHYIDQLHPCHEECVGVLANLHGALRDDGVWLWLSTNRVYWFDLVYGLLDG
jgi:hypothetical protein